MARCDLQIDVGSCRQRRPSPHLRGGRAAPTLGREVHIPESRGDQMNFEQNLFISYAHIDDQPQTPGEKGWITRFHATLKAI